MPMSISHVGISSIAAAQSAIELAFLPATVMFLMSLAAMKIAVPKKLVAGFQHLAAGIVMSAVAVELVPMVLHSPNTSGNLAGMIIGFTLGITVFLLLGVFCGEPEEEDDAEAAEAPKKGKKSKRNQAIVGMAQSGKHVVPPYPSALAFAVCLDAFIDGFLIGISSASAETAGGGGSNAGVVMAVALTIEMGFLGLTFAMSTVRKQSTAVAFISILAPPCLILLGCAVGAFGAAQLAAEPSLHVGLVSFGIAALLYLVTEELLLEAHESLGGEEHVWWIDALFFVGFLASFVLEKVTDG